MGLAGLIERQGFMKRRANLPLLDEIESKLQLGHAAHPGPNDPPLVAEERIEMRDGGLDPTAQSEVDHGAARLQAIEIDHTGGSADGIDDDIDSVPPGPGAHGRRHTGPPTSHER